MSTPFSTFITNRNIYDIISLGGSSGVDCTTELLDLQTRILEAEEDDIIGATLLFPPGEWEFEMDPNATGVSQDHIQYDTNFKKLKMIGYGATLRNTIGADTVAPIHPYPGIYQPWTAGYVQYPIDTASVGDDEVFFQTASEAQDFTVGEMVMIASGDCQFNGGPPNLQYHDYVTITEVDEGANSITFKPPLSNNHLETNPEIADGGFVAPGLGKARVWKLNRPRVVGHDGCSFDVERYYEGFTLDSGGNMAISGKRVDLINIKARGNSPTNYGWVNIKGSEFIGEESNQNAPDKLGGYLNYEDSDLVNGLTAVTSTIEFLRATRTTFHDTVLIGAKYSNLQQCKIPQLNMTTYGMADLIVDQCKVGSVLSPTFMNVCTALDEEDYVEGRITIAKSRTSSFLGNWFPVIGAAVWPIIPSTTNFTGVWGIVYGVSDDVNNIYIDTYGLPDTLPAAFISGGEIRFGFQKFRNITVNNSHGCYEIERLSQNPSNLQQTKLNVLFTGIPSGSKSWVQGQLKSIKVNVLKAYTGAQTGVKASLGMAAYNSSHSNVGVQIKINAHVAGLREINKTDITGEDAGDTFKRSDTSNITTILDSFTQGSFTFSYTDSSGVAKDLSGDDPHQLPVIEIIAETDEEAYNYNTRWAGTTDLAEF